MTAIVHVDRVVKTFGGFRAVDEASLMVEEGSIHALIGPNGAGKTTLFHLLTGFLRLTSGSIRFAGRDVAGLPPHRLSRLGIVCTFQITNLFPQLTVRESVECAVLTRLRRQNCFWRSPSRQARDEAEQVLAEVGLADVAEQRSGTLSHGDQRVLEVALAVATRPRVLLLDEPTAGMSPVETERTVTLIRRLARENALTVLLVEHDVKVVFSVSDRITVMHQGRIVKEGAPADIRKDPEVIEIYLGEPA